MATRTARRSVAVLTASAAVLLVAGCGSGQVGTIGSQVAAVNGGQGQSDKIAVRDVTIQFPSTGSTYSAGQDAPLQFTISNSGTTPDELESVTTPAGQVTLSGSKQVPGQATLVSVAQEASDGTSIPPASPANNAAGLVQARITGLTQPLKPGLNVSVTFTFAKAGAITVPVPLAHPRESKIS
ncbi:MAG: copper chaperone PCu(A)C [Mycobacteriaceae bacterium]